MASTRIDIIRNKIAEIGNIQNEYNNYFPSFADKVVEGLGEYLGDKKCVALTTNQKQFQFDAQYRREGLGFEGGRYRIPIMIKFDNLNDSGFLAIRMWLLCSKTQEQLSISIDDESSVSITESDLNSLYEKIYKHIQDRFSKNTWFEENRQNYQATGIGFLSN